MIPCRADLHILILEDNPTDAELVEFELQLSGIEFTSRVVMTEEDFTRELWEFIPDLILSDYDLPRYNGAMALARAKQSCPDTPFILVTGAVSEDRAIEILTQGAKDYVLKNRLQQRLIPAVHRALAEAEEHRARKQAETGLRDAHTALEKQVAKRTSELNESRERLSLALTSAGMGAFEWDIVHDRRRFDEHVFSLLGMEAAGFTGTSDEFFRVIHPDDRSAVQAALQKAVGEDSPYEAEYRAIWPDGSVHHISTRGKVQRDGTGRPLRLVGVCWDVTESKRMEEALRRNNERLELLSYTASRLLASDQPQQLVEELCLKVMKFLDCQAFFNFLVDETAGRLHLNACAGIPPETARDIEWLDFGVAVCGCAARDSCRIVAENIPETPDVRTELVKSFGIKAYACHPLMEQNRVLGTLSFGTRSRTTFSADDLAMMKAVADQVAIAMSRVRMEEALRMALLKAGDSERSAAISADITGREEMENAFKACSEQLEEAKRELENFSYSVSHDLKAPLRAIEGYHRMFMKKYGGTLDEEATRMLDVIHSNAKMMAALTDGLLSFSRVLKSDISKTEIDMDRLFNEVWHEIRDVHEEQELELRLGTMLPACGDRALIRQVLFNLAANAVKFTKNRKPAIIEIGSYEEPGRTVYCIKDNGAGFDMAYYSKLFGVFQRLHDHETYEGAGMGLAIVQRIIQRHGGRVWAEGEVDKGAIFCFTLPHKVKGE